MEALFIYFLKLIVCSGVMFLYYQLFLRDKTFHHYNRFYLIATLLVSALLPLIKIDYFTIAVSPKVYQLMYSLQEFKPLKHTGNDFNYYQLVFIAIGLVSFFLLGRLLYGIALIFRFKKEFKVQKLLGIQFYTTDLLDAPFSFFRNLFWKKGIELDSTIGKQILKHEMVHIEQKHSIDKILSEVIVALFWFNPFFYLIKKEIGLIHEYLADKKSVKNSDTKAFAQMLLASHFSGQVLPGTSPFLNSNLKKRLQMLKTPTTKYSYARRILALPTVFVLAFAYMVNAKNTEIKELNTEAEAKVKSLKPISSNAKNDTKDIQSKDQDSKIINDHLRENIVADTTKSKKEGKEVVVLLDNKIHIIEGNKDNEMNVISFDSKKGNFPKDSKLIVLNKKDMDSLMKSVELSELQANVLKKHLENAELNAELAKTNASVAIVRANAAKIAAEKAKLNHFKNETNNFKVESLYFDSSQESKLTKKEQKKLKELNKKQAELRKKQAELSKEKAEILKNDFSRSLGIKPMDIQIYPKGNLTLANSKNSVENVRVFVNGKEVERGEMDKIDPKTIEKINVNKSNKDGVSSGEIHIQLK